MTSDSRWQVMTMFALLGAVLLPAWLSLPGNPAAGQAAQTPAPPADAQPAPEYTVLQKREDRLIVTLPNRLIVIAQEVPTAPVVSAQVWVKTGSIYEQEFVGAGISHFLEHMLSGGTTTTRTESETNATLGRIGARTNAATGLDNVRYYINTTAEHADTAVALLSDYMQNNVMDEREVEREREVIQSEFSMGEGEPGRIFWKLTQQARYNAHPARHPTIGYIDEFLKISRDDLADFYQRMYPPNNLVFVVAGDIDKQAVVDQLAELWKDVAARELPELSFPVEPEITEPRTMQGHADIRRPQLRLAWPGTQLAGEHDYALDLLASVLGQGETSRLVQTVRNEQRLVSSISAFNLSFTWGKGFFGIDAELLPAKTVSLEEIEDREDGTQVIHHQGQVEEIEITPDRVKQAVLTEVDRIRERGVTAEELDRAKRQVMVAVLSANQTAEGIASRLARDTIGMGDPDYLQRYAEAIALLTAEDLQAAAERYLKPDRLIEVQLLPYPPEYEPAPLERPAVEVDPDAFEQQPVTLDNEQTLAAMRALDAPEGELAEAIEVEPIKQFTLDNGLRLLVQRSTVVPAVSVQMYWKGGLLGETPGREGVANAMATMMMRGTEKHTAQQLAEAIENLGASVGTSTGNNTTYAQAHALKGDWQTVLGLMAEVMLRPSFPEDEWQRMRPRLLAAIERQRDSWYGELSQHFRQAFYTDHPWQQTPLGRADVVAELGVADLAAYHAQQLAAEQTVIVVVGDVDPGQVHREVAAQFGSMPRESAVPFDPPLPAPPESALHQVQTAKPVAAVTMGFGPTIDRAHEDYAAIQVLARLISDFPGGWLNIALRGEGPGLAYAQWAGHMTGLVPGYFQVTFNSSDVNLVPEALRRTVAVLERAKQGPIAPDELARAKAGVMTSEFFGRQSNSDRAMSAGLDELYGISDPTGERFRTQLESLTAADVQRVARQYLVNPVTVVLSREAIDAETLNAALKPATPLEALGD